jgi:serine/threonine protein phosphatase 1
VGDIHGCRAALTALLRTIRLAPSDTLVLLGDYVDRGPDSRGVLEQILGLGGQCRCVTLMGNHEEMLLAALQDARSLRFWLRFGGQETLESYGVNDIHEIPAAHLRLLQACPDYYETASHVFVHAYYDPELPLCQQESYVLRWASPPVCFPEPHCSGKVAIVGHTVQEDGEIFDYGFFKCIDTFCYGRGWLTALDVDSGQVWQASVAGNLRPRRAWEHCP